jgi:hypothetical protein
MKQFYGDLFQPQKLNLGLLPRAAKAGAMGNAGNPQMDGSPILLDLPQIGACARLKGFPAGVQLALASAHEVGHKFNLFHPLRTVPVAGGGTTDLITPIPQPANLQNLGLDHYSPVLNQPNFYVRLERYDYLGSSEISDQLVPVVGFLRTNPIVSPLNIVPPAGTTSCQGLPNCIYRYTTRSPLAPNTGGIQIENQLGRIMDWTPRYTLTDPLQWRFDPRPPDERSKIRVKFVP